MEALIYNTFSITARCEQTGMLGVAVSTARPCVGGLVPYAKAGVGAIATQALVNPYFGIDGLVLLEQNGNAEYTKSQLLEIDTDGDLQKRQFAVVDAKGQCAAFTGQDTVDWAGHIIGDGFVVCGNMLVGKETIKKMADAYQNMNELPFPERLLLALEEGQKAGGDKRGKQSAALYVVHQEVYPLVDIRVDENQDPVFELKRIYHVCQKDLFPYLKKAPKRYSVEGGR